MKIRSSLWIVGAILAGIVLGALSAAWQSENRPTVSSLTDPDPAVRAWALRGLNREGNEQAFIEALRDENSDVRLVAADRLGGKGARASERSLALVAALKDEHTGVHRAAAWALGEIGPEAWPAVRDALRDDSPRVRAGAVLAVWFGDVRWRKSSPPWPSEDLAPILNPLLSDPDDEVRSNARQALRLSLGEK